MPYTKEAYEQIKHLRMERLIFLGIIIIAAVAQIISAILISNDRNTIRHQNLAIQRQRYDSAFNDCVDQNLRNASTIQVLNREIARLPKSERANAQRSKQFTILLIDALAPHQNCKQVAAAVLRPNP